MRRKLRARWSVCQNPRPVARTVNMVLKQAIKRASIEFAYWFTEGSRSGICELIAQLDAGVDVRWGGDVEILRRAIWDMDRKEKA